MTPLTGAFRVGEDLWGAATRNLERGRDAPVGAAEFLDVEVGTTPSEVVYSENKLDLLRYESPAEPTHETPILIVYALINRPYILDLQPDRSVVRRLLENGFDVFLIDWGEPSRLDGSLRLDDYIDRYIDNCVDAVRAATDADAVNLLGYCMGGTMSAIYAALEPEKVRNLGLMAASLYFDDSGGVLEIWGDESYFDPGAISEAYGTVPAEFFDSGFAFMDPVDNAVTKYVRLNDNVDDEEFVRNFARMERWLEEGIDMAGETYRQFIEEIYQSNALYRGELTIGGRRVDLDALTMPILQIVAEYDHLVPPSASVPFNDVVPSDDLTTIEFATGHIGLSVSSRSHESLWPEVAGWFADRSGPLDDGDDTADTGTEPSDSTDSTDASPDATADLTAIDGVGDAYATRLRDAGVDSLADLAAADPETLAAALDVSQTRIEDWVDQARALQE